MLCFFTAFNLVQSGWGLSGLPDWGSVVDYAEVKGPIDPDELVFPPAPPLYVSKASTGHLLEAVESTAVACGLKERALRGTSVVRLY